MSPEEAFEAALQRYEVAVREYKVAIAALIASKGKEAAPILEQANNRICYLDAAPGAKPMVKVSQDEVDRRAAMARVVVDSEIETYDDVDAVGNNLLSPYRPRR